MMPPTRHLTSSVTLLLVMAAALLSCSDSSDDVADVAATSTVESSAQESQPTPLAEPTLAPRPAPTLAGANTVIKVSPTAPGSEVDVEVFTDVGAKAIFSVAWWNGRSYEWLYDYDALLQEVLESQPETGTADEGDSIANLLEVVAVPVLDSVPEGTIRICLGNISCSTTEVSADA